MMFTLSLTAASVVTQAGLARATVPTQPAQQPPQIQNPPPSTITIAPATFSAPDVMQGVVTTTVALTTLGVSATGETLEVSAINGAPPPPPTAVGEARWINLATGSQMLLANANGLVLYRNTLAADVSPFRADTFSQNTQDVTFTLRGIGSGDTASQTMTIVYEGTGPFAGSLVSRRPAWAEIRLAAPNSFDANAYTTLGGVVRNADSFVSENLSKIGFIADGSPDAAGALAFSFNEFDAQASAMAAVLGMAPAALPFDWHGAVWHSSLTPQLVARLMAHPAEAKTLLTTILDSGFAYRPWLGFDVNEVQRATATQDQQYDYWRGPIYNPPDAQGARTMALKKAGDQDHTSNGSIWYQAFSEAAAADPAYWPHHPGYWWLHTVGWANANSKKVVYQDFNFEAGRLWGTTTDAPVGYKDASAPRSDEMLKRRRILDAINYALAHGYRIDAVAFQSHIRTDRMLDENDLIAFLHSLQAMGVGVEVTELDVEPSGLPLGYPASHIDAGATPAEADEILAYAGAYARRYLDILLKHSPLARIGGWSDWAPPGGLRRLAMVDRTGVTVIGEAVSAALNAADAPAARILAPVQRRYSFVNGVASDLWRAATNPAAPGFPIAGGNAKGTPPMAGSGGAVLPLTNTVPPVPGAPVGPVWFDGTQVRDYDPAAMALALQWYEVSGAEGPRLALLSGGAPVLTVRKTGASIIAEAAGGATVAIGAAQADANQRVALSWTGGVATMALDGGAAVTLALPSTPQQVAVMGDGAAQSAVRATLLDLLRDPMDGAALTARSIPEGAHVPSAADILSGANAL